MKIVDFTTNHIEAAISIAKRNYETERLQVPSLPSIDILPDMTGFVKNGQRQVYLVMLYAYTLMTRQHRSSFFATVLVCVQLMLFVRWMKYFYRLATDTIFQSLRLMMF